MPSKPLSATSRVIRERWAFAAGAARAYSLSRHPS